MIQAVENQDNVNTEGQPTQSQEHIEQVRDYSPDGKGDPPEIGKIMTVGGREYEPCEIVALYPPGRPASDDYEPIVIGRFADGTYTAEYNGYTVMPWRVAPNTTNKTDDGSEVINARPGLACRFWHLDGNEMFGVIVEAAQHGAFVRITEGETTSWQVGDVVGIRYRDLDLIPTGPLTKGGAA